MRKYLELPNGGSTDDTIRIVIGNIDTRHFFQVVVQLLFNTVDGVFSLSETETHERTIVAVDGKESRGSKRNETSKGAVRALQTLNVYACDYRICIGQKFIEEKANEEPALVLRRDKRVLHGGSSKRIVQENELLV